MLENANPILKQYLDARGKSLAHFKYPVSRNHYLQRCWPVIERILSDKTKVTVIDAGCGHAYESILFAALGADTIGIDLRKDGFKVAAQTIAHFRSIFPSLNVSLLNRDIFAALNTLRADVIYVRQAFSHIHPAEAFVKLAYDRLNSNGILVINDSNWFNPLAMLEVTLEHWRHKQLGWFVIDKYKDPATNVSVPYAVERMMTPIKVKRLLRNCGFTIREVDITGYFPVLVASKFPALTLRLESIIKTFPLISSLGAEYTITGAKL